MQLGQRLGEGIDPRMFVQDYSGFTKAAEIQAQGMQNLGEGIGKAATQVGDYFKQQGEKKKLVKQSSLQIDAALQLFPDLAPSLQSVKERMRDENIPLSDRAAEAEVVANLINMGVGEMRNRSNMSFQQEQAMADAIYKQQQLGMQERRTRATEFSAMQGAKPTFDLKKATITSPDGQTFEMDIPYDKEKGMFFDPDAGKYIKDVNKWGFGESSYVNGEAMPTPTSQNDIIAPSTAYSFGKAVGGPDELQDKWTNKGYTSTGPNLVEGVVAVNTNKYPLGTIFKDSESGKVYVAADRHGNKDSGVIDFFQNPENYTGGKTNKRLSIIGSIPKNKIPKTKEGMSQLIEQYSNVPDYSTSSNASQIDGALSMGGDMSQQAMGTPEQQAQVARMIEQSAGMRTAQAAPSGAMPTEPRIAQPQPAAQQAPQYQVRPGFVPVGPKGGQKEAKIITGEEAKALNLDPLGTYEASYQDGQLTGVQTIKAAPSVGDIIAMEKRAEEKVAKQELNEAVKAKSERMISLMTELRDHPGFGGLFGVGYTGIPGTESANAKVLYDQIQAQGFMEAIKDMKGMGALSNAEGEKASAAFVGINPSMSEAAALKRIDEVVKYIKEGEKRIQSGNLIETKENKGPSISGANSYFNQYKPPAR
jgi:hypothetical protein